MLCPLYISEMASPETRGSLVSLEQFSIVLGVVLGFWTGFATRSLEGASAWRIPLGIQIGPGILLTVGILWLPPSPRHLVLQGREALALQTLAQLRDRDEGDPLLQVRLRIFCLSYLNRTTARAPRDACGGEISNRASKWQRKRLVKSLQTGSN